MSNREANTDDQGRSAYGQWVDVSFDCLPLRTVGRVDIPIDASPAFRQRCERIKDAIARHGGHNAYYLYNARCDFHLTNAPDRGLLGFHFEGTVLTDSGDKQTRASDLQVSLAGETCHWLTQPVVDWFAETVNEAVRVEFDRYIAAGDLDRAEQRIRQLQDASDAAGGFVGMYL